MLSNLTISDVYRCFPCKLCLWKRDECNEIFVPQAHGFHSSLSNQQKKGFLYMYHPAFCDPVEALQRHHFYWSGGPLHFAP